MNILVSSLQVSPDSIQEREQLQAPWTSCESSALKLLTQEPQLEQEIMGRKVTINTAANMHVHIAHNSLI